MTHYTNHTHPSPNCSLLPLCLAVCGLTPFAALLQQGDHRTVDASGLRHMEKESETNRKTYHLAMTNIAMENGPFIDGLLMFTMMFTLKMVFKFQMVFTFENGILPSINGPL